MAKVTACSTLSFALSSLKNGSVQQSRYEEYGNSYFYNSNWYDGPSNWCEGRSKSAA